MIQRIQTIWLLLAILSASIAFFLPFAVEFSSAIDTTVVEGEGLNAINNILATILIGDIIVCGFIGIGTFKKRKIQKAFCVIVSLLSAVCIAYMIYAAEFEEGVQRKISFGVIAPILSFVFGILAFNGVRKDDKLVKSLDRLR